MKRSQMALGLLAALTMLISSCGGAASPVAIAETQQPSVTEAQQPSTTESATKKETYVMVVFVSQVSYWIDARLGMEAAGRDLGVNVEFTGPTDADVANETATVDALIGRGVDGIMISPVDAAGLTPAINRAVDAGIAVIVWDGDAPQSKRLSFVGTDNYTAGYFGGQQLAKLVGGKGKIGGSMGQHSPVMEDRLRGYQDALKEYPDIEFVQLVLDESDLSVGTREVGAMLQAHPDLSGIFGLDNVAGSGIVRAIQEAGIPKGQIHVMGFDKSDDTLKLIRDGWIDGTLVQKTFAQGYLSTYLAYAYKHGTFSPSGWSAQGISPMPYAINTGMIFVTAKDVLTINPNLQ
jgi:ribose transport system substrate-binding protein